MIDLDKFVSPPDTPRPPIRRRSLYPCGTDAAGDKRDFQPSGQIVHAAAEPQGAAEQYYSEKIAELVMTQHELAAVTRERDALVRVVHLAGAMAGHPKDANEGCRNICKLVRDTKDKLASGELRKPGV